MIATLISYAALFSAVLMLLLGVSLLGTLLSLRMTLAGFDTHVTGLVLSAYYAGLVVGSFLCRHWIERVGHIRAFAAFAAVSTAAAMVHGLYLSPVLWGILRLIMGITTTGLYMVIESWLNECTEAGARGRVFSVYMVFTFLGLLGGQLLLNIGRIDSPHPFFIAGMLLSLCLVPVAVTRSVHPELPETKRSNPFHLLRKSPLGMLGCFTAGLINGAFYTMGPVFGNHIGLPISGVTFFMAATIFGGLLLQWPIGMVSDRVNRSSVLIAQGVLIAAICIAAIVTANISYSALFLVMACFGGVAFTVYPVAVARAHDIFEPADVIPVSSALLLSFGLGASAGPILASLTMSGVKSPNGFFLYCATVSGLYAVTGFYLRKSEIITLVPVDEQVDFVPMRSTSPVVTVIDPRGDIEMEDDEPTNGQDPKDGFHVKDEPDQDRVASSS